MMRKWFWLLGGLITLMFISGCGGISLAEDITPPPNLQNATAAQPSEVQAVSTAFPLLPPDPAQGKVIYEEKCLPCHGSTGMGDGPQASNLPATPPAIGSPEVARKARPADWFTVVSEGRLDRFMPGFSGSLNDRQRWDVVAYVFTLSRQSIDLGTGKQVYEARCASCHGDRGQGSAENAPDWTNQQRLAGLSDEELEKAVVEGQGSMPAFGDQLSASERTAVVAYIRSLTYASSGGGEQAQTTPEAKQTPQGEAPVAEGTPGTTRSLTIRGRITGPGGVTPPAGLKVTLIGFEGMNQVSETTTVSGADGSYQFEDVQVKPGTAFMVRVEKDGYTFNSDILHPSDVSGEVADLPVTVYETSTDPSQLMVDRLHVFFDFSLAGKVQVVELFIIANPTDKLIVPAAPDQPALVFSLPEGATNLQLDGGALGDRFVQTADGFGDLAPIAPGSQPHQVLFSYDLPYDRKLDLAIPLPLFVNAAVVMLPPGGVKLESDQLMAAGSRDVQGMTVQLYTASGLSAKDPLRMRLSGKAAGTPANGNGHTGLLIGLGAFGLALVGAGVWLLRQKKGVATPVVENEVEPPEESEESLLDAIVALDDLYQAGKLPEEAYTLRRAELKERLRRLRGTH
ncbi:cytochrome c, mono- and diheme variants [Anaerolinea thermolimosa]|uniref:c-type cytochrome n=1 Tax=Anaerolinea thermolimosa TaxID=229919 RepID=UPI000ACF195C|nr:c-type cytochrome [Anaerolinea thermolimosa]GAP07617.1 cytochrome c, mono- and diheme variants [Anaerolinea thermolimosa]